ncbi:PREDICTED: uncharacterized protein LOC108553951 [Eufriesea mexicana]|uniref:uncharacterized protein LOC108553951 n=1 Tax=Eufriesea mexicana TaxID=516756 RepID=UPI00083C5E6F|nr:PREDICTED: uncharacterized protein LOC108553951 [Eufriesea mexicana]
MQLHVALLAFAVILVISIEAKPIWSDLYVSSYQYPPGAINVHPQLLQYQSSPYYLYNVHTDASAAPAAAIAQGKLSVSHLPAYSVYYGTPVYDFRFPLNPVFPILKPAQPGGELKPTAPSTTTMKPADKDGEDGIEKLDSKVEPGKETKKPNEEKKEENMDDESITIDSI